MEKKSYESGSSLNPRNAIRCARAAFLLSSLRLPPLRRRITAASEEDEASRVEWERLRRSLADLRAELALERSERRGLLRFAGFEVSLLVLLLLLLLVSIALELWGKMI